VKKIILFILVLLIASSAFSQDASFSVFAVEIGQLTGHDWIEMDEDQRYLFGIGILYGLYWGNIAILGYDADGIGMLNMDDMANLFDKVDALYAMPENRDGLIFQVISLMFLQVKMGF